MRTIYVTGIIALVSVAMALAAVPVSAQPTADSFGVEDVSGDSGTYVEVPVTITNITNGPVQGIRLRIDYNENVLNLTSISNGDLTSAWAALQLGVDRHTMTVATAYTGAAISNGSSGSVVLLNFHVIGSPQDTSPMSMTLIEFSNPDGKVGTAPARNGMFTVTGESRSTGNGGGGGGGGYVPATPTPTPTATPTSTVTVTSTPAVTPSPVLSPSPTISPSPTGSPIASPSPAPAATPSPEHKNRIPGFEDVFAIASLAISFFIYTKTKTKKRR